MMMKMITSMAFSQGGHTTNLTGMRALSLSWEHYDANQVFQLRHIDCLQQSEV
jgi:hypothetical protein